jgi:hypothetical protein
VHVRQDLAQVAHVDQRAADRAIAEWSSSVSGEATGIGAGVEREFAADDGRFSDVSSAN